MQRETPEGIVIACDFSGEDWDEVKPMIEGHRGSVISLASLAMAVEQAAESDKPFTCTMCLRDFEPPIRCWRYPDPPATANPEAVICWDCIQQADRSFARDPDTEWDRQVPSDDRWR